jgi:hypothetical protein
MAGRYKNDDHLEGICIIIVFLDIIHSPVFCLKTTFRRLDSVSVLRKMPRMEIEPEDGDRIQSPKRRFKIKKIG